VIHFNDLIKYLETKAKVTLNEQAQLVRLISEKNSRAAKVKDEVVSYWVISLNSHSCKNTQRATR